MCVGFRRLRGEENLQHIQEAYCKAAKAGKAPRSLDDLKPFLKKIGDPEELTRSPNDGLPYVLVPGLTDSQLRDGALVIAHEQQGKDGRRQAVVAAGLVYRMTEAEWSDLKFPQ